MHQSRDKLRLTPIERLVRRTLISMAKARTTITYAHLAERLAVSSPVRLEQPWTPMFTWLGRVSMFEHAYNRPLLSALVVGAHSERPGSGFFALVRSLGIDMGTDPLAFGEAERERVYRTWESNQDSGDRAEETVDLLDGGQVTIRQYPDGRLRIVVSDGPCSITAARLKSGTKGNCFVELSPVLDI